MEKIRIVVAEDHPLVRLGTIHLLEQNDDFEIVGSAEDGQQALDLLEKFHPDILLSDIRMPKIDGIEVVRRMKAGLSPNTKAIMLTAHDDEDYVVSLLREGVSGYLLKTTDARELAQCIRAAHVGATVVHPSIAAMIARNSSQDHKPQVERLSLRERAILTLLADGLRNPDIAKKLGLSVRTVEGHINRLFTKLAVSSRAEAVAYVRAHDIVGRGQS